LRGEHPQIAALILSRLDAKHAASVLQVMDTASASDVLFRMARLDKVSPDLALLIEDGLSGKADLGAAAPQKSFGGGPAAVAKLLNLSAGPVGDELMKGLGGRDAELAAEVKKFMFVFEDLIKVDSKGIQRVLREVDTKELALSLKAASDDLRKHIMSNMSERAASALEEEVELLGPVRVRDVEAAHARIIEAVRRLDQAGEILIRGQGASDDIIP